MSAPVTRAEWERQRREAAEAMPAVVAEVGLPKVLLPYQARAVRLLDDAATRVLVVEKSRRIGLTWGLAAYAVLRAGRERRAKGMDVMYISYSQEMTREFIDACAMWARAFNVAALASEEFLFADNDETGDRSIKAFRIGFASGFEIIALSSAPRGLRGKQGCVIIDEAAFVDSLAELLKAALAFLMWGGQVVVCSTHDGAENVFNQTVQDILAGRKPYAHLRIDFDDALREGLYQRICLVTGKDWSPEAEAAWRQDIIDFYGDGADEELFCVPSMGSGAWLTAPLIEARMTAAAPVLRLELPPDYLHRDRLARAQLLAPFMEALNEALKGLDQTPNYAAGFDFARVADLSVLNLLAIEKTLKRREALTVEMRGVPGDEQKAIVGEALGAVRERLVGAAFDATGMGWTVAEDMGRIFGLREGEDSADLGDQVHRGLVPAAHAAAESRLRGRRYQHRAGCRASVRPARGQGGARHPARAADPRGRARQAPPRRLCHRAGAGPLREPDALGRIRLSVGRPGRSGRRRQIGHDARSRRHAAARLVAAAAGRTAGRWALDDYAA
jgi:phage FluMu gp28-like protein